MKICNFVVRALKNQSSSSSVTVDKIWIFLLVNELGLPPFFVLKLRGVLFFHGDPAVGRASRDRPYCRIEVTVGKAILTKTVKVTASRVNTHSSSESS